MRTTLKIVLPLIVSVALVSLLFAGYQVRREKHLLRNDLSRRAEILGESLQESVEPVLEQRAPERSLQRLVKRFGQREHLKGVAVYGGAGSPPPITPRMARWQGTLRTGEASGAPTLPKGEILDQLHHEVTHLANDLNAARAVAEEEARLRDSNSSTWTAERLRVSLRNKLQDTPLFVVSNREPYMHVFNEKDKSIHMIVPARGEVTGLEPVLVACNGTWLANGSGNADRE